MTCPTNKFRIQNVKFRISNSLLHVVVFITSIIVLLSFVKTVASAKTIDEGQQLVVRNQESAVSSESSDADSRVLGTQTISQPQPSVTVSAHVGAYRLNLSGYASPFASIILRSGGIFYRSTTADERGYWEIDDISINKDFSSFCLEHIDFRNLGSSTACFSVPPAKEDISKQNLFLPPTIALQRSEITAGGNAVVFGYSMPSSKVTIHLQNGKTYEVTADEHGYYQLTLKNLPAGTYELFATAVYQGQTSASPTTTVRLTALTWWQQILKWLHDLFNWLWSVLTGLGLGPLWLILPLIPVILYLIVKIWPEQFTFIYDSQIYVFFHPQKKLHHAWFVGY